MQVRLTAVPPAFHACIFAKFFPLLADFHDSKIPLNVFSIAELTKGAPQLWRPACGQVLYYIFVSITYRP
jgi:hypothetical protein